MSIRESTNDRSDSHRTASRRRHLVRARALVAVAAVTALTGVVIVAPAAWGVPPGAPGAPTASAGNAQITLTVPPPSGDVVTRYDATCTSIDGGGPGTGSDTTQTIVVTGVDNGHAYTCTVIANNSDGPSAPSVASNSVTPSAPAPPTTVPDAPPTPSVVAGDARLTVTFSAPASNGGLTISRYTITCTAQSDGTDISKSWPTAGSVTLTNVSNGETYKCAVSAHNALGDGPFSNASTPVTPVPAGHAPDAPGRPAVAAGDTEIVVTFGQPNDNGSAINSDTATCTSSNGGATGNSLGLSPSIPVFGLTNGKTYTCTVFASNGLGNGPSSSASLPVTPNGAPDAPLRPAVAGGDGRITVNFSPPAFNGGSPITGYAATCTSFDDGSRTSLLGSAAPIVISNLINGVTYSCDVVAEQERQQPTVAGIAVGHTGSWSGHTRPADGDRRRRPDQRGVSRAG